MADLGEELPFISREAKRGSFWNKSENWMQKPWPKKIETWSQKKKTWTGKEKKIEGEDQMQIAVTKGILLRLLLYALNPPSLLIPPPFMCINEACIAPSSDNSPLIHK